MQYLLRSQLSERPHSDHFIDTILQNFTILRNKGVRVVRFYIMSYTVFGTVADNILHVI